MKTTRTRQRIVALSCSTATVCDQLYLFGKPKAYRWEWLRQPKGHSNMRSAKDRALALLQQQMKNVSKEVGKLYAA
jgi:hypothetical protein